MNPSRKVAHHDDTKCELESGSAKKPDSLSAVKKELQDIYVSIKMGHQPRQTHLGILLPISVDVS